MSDWLQYLLFDTSITVFAIVCTATLAVWMLTRTIHKHTRAIMSAQIEQPDRPFTVSFSPDAPGLSDAQRVDAWVRTTPAESLFFNPVTQRWTPQRFSYGVGLAFVDGAMVTFRAVPTTVDEEFVFELNGEIADGITTQFLERLSAMDPNEVFSIVEACGLVRQFDAALARLDPPPAMAASFGRGRAIDIG